VAVSGLTFYGDASGKDQTEPLAVGGFVATVEAWKAFDPEWKAVLEANGLHYFRMSEFAHSTNQFKQWKGQEGRRIGLIDSLVKILERYTLHWSGACILKRDYERVDADYRLHEYATRYAICAVTLTEHTITWCENQHRTEPLEFVFEEGDIGAGQVSDFVFANTGHRPSFRGKTVTPLQAADFAAYEVLKVYKTILLETDKLFEKIREPLNRLHNINSYWGQFREEDLRALCRLHDVERRQSSD
jgi:hypothetical protein